MADLPLIAWDEVPEGHYVWCRQKGHDAVDWQRWRKRHGELVTPSGTWIKPDLYEFCAAEQQPGEQTPRTLRAAIEAAKNALHRISLASQNSMSSKEECGRIARETIPTLTAALALPDAGEGIEASVVRDLPGCPVSARCVLEGCRDFAPPSQPSLTREEWAQVADWLDWVESSAVPYEQKLIAPIAAKCRAHAEPETGR